MEDDEDSNELSRLLKSFNKLDNYVVKYIYEKYIRDIQNSTINQVEEHKKYKSRI